MDFNCYNFLSQEVFITESDPSHVYILSDNKLLIIYETIGLIKIYDLTIISNENKVLITLPLIEKNVKQVIHSDFGKYLAIFGDTESDDNSKSVRVYCNYWLEEQPIRVRPVGSLADSHRNQNENYNSRELLVPEIIEFLDPFIRSESQTICSCESTANLVICCGHKIIVYCYQTYKYSHNVIKADFVSLLEIRLQWFPTKVVLLEDYMTLMCKSHCSVLKIIFDYEENGINLSDNNSIDNHSSDNDCIEWDFNDFSKSIRLPTMFDSREGLHGKDVMISHSQQVIGPVDQSLSCKFTIDMNHSLIESPICRAALEVLLCQHFEPNDPLIDIDLISYYKFNNYTTDPLDASNLNSYQTNTANKYPFSLRKLSDLVGTALVVMTKTNLNYYHILKRIQLKQTLEISEQIRDYSLNKIDDTLHLLTDKGLQTCALNFIPVFLNYKTNLPVFTLSFSNFLDINQLFNTRNYLVLVTKLDNNKKTIYCLKKPLLREICYDINSIIDEMNMKIEDQLNLLSYINSVLYFSFEYNAETDSELMVSYHKICVKLSNILIEIKNFNTFDTKKLSLDIINIARLELSHLINFNSKYEIIIEFLKHRLINDKKLDIIGCDFELLKKFLNYLSETDLTLLSQLSLNQYIESDIRIIFIELLKMNTESELCQLVLCKLMLDNNQINSASDCLKSLNVTTETILLENHKFILKHKSYVNYLGNNIENNFYKFLKLLTKEKKSVKYVYELIINCEKHIIHNYLTQCYNEFEKLFDWHLIYELISLNINLLCNDKNQMPYKPIESIDKEMVYWIEGLPPKHIGKLCYCVKCNKIVSDLYILLYYSINEDIIKNEVNNLLNTIDQNFEWLFTAKFLSMNCMESIELLLKDFPNTALPYVRDVCNSNTVIMKKVIELLEKIIDSIENLDINSNTGSLLSYTLDQLALMLSPEDFITILPNSWKQFAVIYVEKCIINFQAKNLKEKIINLGLELKSMLST